jgi:hypothetical protein
MTSTQGVGTDVRSSASQACKLLDLCSIDHFLPYQGRTQLLSQSGAANSLTSPSSPLKVAYVAQQVLILFYSSTRFINQNTEDAICPLHEMTGAI